MNNNYHPRAPEWGWEGKLGPCHVHCGQNELSPQLHILEKQLGLPPTECQNSLLLVWIASGLQWPCASHMRFLQHIKNDPTFSFSTEVVHQDDYAWIMCNPEQEHLGTFPCMEGDCESTSPASCSSPKWHTVREGKNKRTKKSLISEVK